MKITALNHRVVSVPVQYPVISSVRHNSQIVFVILDVLTSEGISGISYAQAFNIHGAKAIKSCLNYLEGIVIGEDPRDIEKIWRKNWETMKLLGLQGLPMFALSMVDIALWDIFGKSVNLPVCRLLRGTPGAFDSYQSDGLWLVSALEAAKQAEEFAIRGFSSMKMRLGRKYMKEDIQVVAEIRKAVGENVEILADVNQGWIAEQAMNMEKHLLAAGIGWLEEPIEAENMEGHSRLSDKMQVRIATGENLYGVRPFQHFLQMNAASVYTPDLQRIGGITGWIRINSLMEQYHILSGIHLFPEFAVHLFPIIKYPVKLEWMGWAGALFKEPLKCEEGVVKTPDRPGFGFAWDEERIAQYQIE